MSDNLKLLHDCSSDTFPIFIISNTGGQEIRNNFLDQDLNQARDLLFASQMLYQQIYRG